MLVVALGACGGPPHATVPPARRAAETVQEGAATLPVDPAATAPVPAAEPPIIWVTLGGVSRAAQTRVRANGGWTLTRLDGAAISTGRALDGDLLLAAAGARLAGQPLSPEGAVLRPDAGSTLQLGDVSYPGSLRVARVVGGGWRVSIVTDLETYVALVVNSEIPAAFPREAQRTQAILARTYALTSSQRASPTDPLVLTDTGLTDQEFNGIAPVAAHREVASDAVASTRGMVLMEGAAPLRAWYHSTCGGSTCPAGPVFKVPTTPALSGVPCTWCADSKYAQWDAQIPGADVAKAAGLQGALERFTITATTLGGRASEVEVRAGGATRRGAAAAFRLRVGPSQLRSMLLGSATVEGGDLVVHGRGWGHGVGLCQMGAKTLASRGVPAEEIVHIYYPGAQLLRLW